MNTDTDASEGAASWRGWALAAEGADQPQLAFRLWSTVPAAPPAPAPPGSSAPDAPHPTTTWGAEPEPQKPATPWETELGCLRALILQRRFGEAMGAARALGAQVRPAPGDPVDLMLAAAHAAYDDAAYEHLRAAAAAPVPSMPAPQLLRIVAAVAEERGDREDALWAWSTLVEKLHVGTPRVAASFATAVVSGRPVASGPCPMAVAVRRAHVALDSVEPHPALDARPVLAAVEGLVERGDLTGARVLLRAVRAVTPSAALDQAARRLARGRTVWVGHAVAHILEALAVVAVVLVYRYTQDLLVTLLAAAGAIFLSSRRFPASGADAVESRARRIVRRLPPPAVGAAAGLTTPAHPTMWMIGRLVGFVAGLRLAGLLMAANGPLVAFRASIWTVIAVLLACAWTVGALGYFAAKQADLSIARRRATRGAAQHRAEVLARSVLCACRVRSAHAGEAATQYGHNHLVPWDGDRRLAAAVAAAFPHGAQVQRCSSTGALWLTTSGDDGQPLALNGLTRL